LEQPALVEDVADLDACAQDRDFAQTLARGLEVLRAYRSDDLFLTNREICQRTGFPKATVSRLTYTLMVLGYLIPIPNNKGFALGPNVLSISHPLLAQLKIRQVIRPYMVELARVAGCTVNLGVRDRLSVIYVDTCRSDTENIEIPDIGSSRPLMSTAIGRALILSMPRKEQVAVLNRLRLHDPACFAKAEPWLRADAERLQKDGYCLSKGDWISQIHAAAVPIPRGPDGIILALNCSTFKKDACDQHLEQEIAPLLVRSAQRISSLLAVPSSNGPIAGVQVHVASP
jgi:DNA-binding IclR family transcriptional regulator